jgi:hypothetical protein
MLKKNWIGIIYFTLPLTSNNETRLLTMAHMYCGVKDNYYNYCNVNKSK